nr:MAG TPA: hypothetical protein [Caudoviricetes sp.]
MAISHFWLILTFHIYWLYCVKFGLYITPSYLNKKSRVDNFSIYVTIYAPQSLRINII